MYVIALTGGIGSGKSEAAKLFASLGVPVIDTDVISHQLTAIGSPQLKEIANVFGQSVLNHDGSLNRPGLREIILNNPDDRRKLEEILHPAIYQRVLEQLEENEKASKPDYQLLVIPLLFENQRYQSLVHKSIAVDCDEQKQIQRAMTRSGLTEAEVKGIMAAQVSRSERIQRADEVIMNNGSLEELKQNVNKMHEKMIKTCIVSK